MKRSSTEVPDWLEFVHFRNPKDLTSVIIQCSMLLSSILILVGLLYVLILVLAISIHHFIFDHDPKKVPDFVKRSVQFDSSDSDDVDSDKEDNEEMSNQRNDPIQRSKSYAENEENNTSVYITKKVNQLDKFLRKDLDVNKKP